MLKQWSERVEHRGVERPEPRGDVRNLDLDGWSGAHSVEKYLKRFQIVLTIRIKLVM